MRTCYRLYFHLLLSCFLELGICLLQLLMCTAVVTAAKSTVAGWKHKNSHSHVALSKPSKLASFIWSTPRNVSKYTAL